MIANLGSWGQKRSKPLIIVAITVVVVGVLALVVFGYLLRLTWISILAGEEVAGRDYGRGFLR